MEKDTGGVNFLRQRSEDGWSSSEDASSDQGSTDGDEEEGEEETKRCKRSRYEEELEFRTRAGFGSELTYESVKDALSALGFVPVLKETNMNISDWDEFLHTCDIDNNDSIDWVEFQNIVDHLLVIEAMQFATEAKNIMRTLRAKLLFGEHDVTPEMNKLRKLWKTSATAKKLLRWFEAMDSKASHAARVSMLESLVFIVPLRDAEEKWLPGLGNKHLVSFGKLHGDQIAGQNKVAVVESRLGLPLPDTSLGSSHTLSFEAASKWWRGMTYAQRGAEKHYKFAYTTLDVFHSKLFFCIVRAIQTATVESGVYNTPIVNAILQIGWQRAKPFFFFHMVGDEILLYVLCTTAYLGRVHLRPSVLLMWTGCLLALAYFISDVLELFAPVYVVWKQRRSVWANSPSRMCSTVYVGFSSLRFGVSHVIGSFWSVFGMVASAYLVGVATLAICTKPEFFFNTNLLSWDKGVPWLEQHPAWLGCLVLIKGTHITMKLMCCRPLGQCIMPAYAALKHRSSSGLLLMLFLMYGNAVMTYNALPVTVYSPDTPHPWDAYENLFQTAMLLFRVTFEGELDPHQLEAENLRIRLNMTEKNATGVILPPANLPTYHHSVHNISLAFVILIHVMLLNVYIGVLSQQYSQFERTERELFEKFRAIFTRMTLFRYRWCIRRLRKCRSRKGGGRHTWIAFDSSLFKDPLEQERCQDETSTLKRQETDGIRLLRIFQQLVPSLASSISLAQAEGTLYERGMPVVQVVPKENCKVSLLFWDARWLREHGREADRIHAEFEASAAAAGA